MALRYRVPFISLRTGTHYVANIYDGNYTGEPTTLRGGAKPFVTEESRDEDMFVPLRTQTGYLRIFDNGFAADGTTRFDWHTLIPDTDLSLRVNLTAEGVIVWQGFLQAQNFGSELYGGPQVREYPVQCMLSAMSAISVQTVGKSVHNFAYVIREAFAALPDTDIDTFVFQGGDDARQWLNKKIMWYNFLDRESDGGYVAKYDYQQVLEDICQYWGWTCRTYGQTVVFAAAYDGNHTDALVLSQANMNNLADEIDITAGTVTDFFSEKEVGNIFASTNQDATLARGYSKATVKSDINRQSPGFTFAPEAVRDILDAAGPYSWVGDGRVGYYTTPLVTAFTTGFMTGLADSMTGFCRRQIFTSEESDEGTNYDIINLSSTASRNGSVSLDSIQPAVYAEGSIKITGSVFVGAEIFNAEALDSNCVKAQLGIGTSRSTAKWFRCRIIDGELVTGWYAEKLSDYGFLISISAGQLDYIGFKTYIAPSEVIVRVCREIPLTEALFGNLYLDLISMDTDDTIEYQIGNLKVSYSRDDLVAPTGTSSPWRKATKQRESSAEYTARNSNKASDPWNADNIFATDKNGSMEYGFGLVMNSNLTFMQTADFNLTPMIPEQRLANLVAAYWAKARQVLSVELRAGAFSDPTRQGVTPRELLQLNNVDYYPLSVSHDWRDDVIKVVMIDNRP